MYVQFATEVIMTESVIFSLFSYIWNVFFSLLTKVDVWIRDGSVNGVYEISIDIFMYGLWSCIWL